ncbi:phage tail sheath gpL-like [Bradyrhizobium sp. GM7.3]
MKAWVGLMRDRRGFCAVVVAGETQDAAVLGGARGIAVAEDVAAAIDAGALAVPDADHAVILGAGREVELLRAPDRGRG